MDLILYQRISGGWEYRFSSNGETYRSFDDDPATAKAKLLRQLGWTQWRWDRAVFRRF
jgi:hypothetical protein